MGFGSSSYTFTTNVSVTTNCGSLVFPEAPDDKECAAIRDDSVPYLVAALVVAAVGVAVFVLARRLASRDDVELAVADPGGGAKLSV